ncbi:cytochrome c oxidase subunit 3 [Parachryseolinea silvisoli]|jgi:cytochrome c oxidase subunit 3|uniref:cytochrome c oxidase subunit 3 n=1 Tax=Parachryseolinea silvisoli TaxID=2873601 RepID=UPI002265B98F|nr:cytochrome c oxidase subunit 3 [Parachryseolinea silvisoli]MCD9017457.1 cytochrome c oxidase subunit 3 [Parachryseolinea silvisoli]
MAVDIKIVEEAREPRSMDPKKFGLWLFMATVVMLFGAWTSAYIVKRGDMGWSEIILPDMFWVNTVIILTSSVPMIWAVRAAKQDKAEQLKIALGVTTILGIAFVVGQFLAFSQMIDFHEHFTGGAVSHSFVYVLSGAHGLHLISGVVVLFIVLRATLQGRVHKGNMNTLEMCATYWHFLGVLWLYLFVFLLLNK